ncbi:hypothetical protein BDZ97DRAFT_2055754 [Flammula alnicola]|nr:hypothetical protein BDZ97DRAFT_2055754 [Flammula alnicola]
MSDRILPQEIDEDVVAYLWNDIVALKALALSCRSFLPACQKQLFARITLFPQRQRTLMQKLTTAPNFQRLLEVSPHLALYVCRLKILDDGRYGFEWLTHDSESLTFCFPLLRCLKALVINYQRREHFIWPSFVRREWFRALLNTLQLQSLVHLDLSYMPLALINHCPNLKSLGLTLGQPGWNVAIDATAASTRATNIYLESLHINIIDDFLQDPGPPINWPDAIDHNALHLTRLKRLYAMAHIEMKGHDEIQKILKRCANTLEEFLFEPCFSILTEAKYQNIRLPDPIDWSVLTALRVLYIRTVTLYNDVDGILDSFPWLIDMFKQLPSSDSNNIEKFILHVQYKFGPLEIVLSPWEELVALFCDRNRFPRLERLGIMISSGDNKAKGEEIVERLEEYVGRLRNSSAFEFRLSLVHSGIGPNYQCALNNLIEAVLQRAFFLPCHKHFFNHVLFPKLSKNMYATWAQVVLYHFDK